MLKTTKIVKIALLLALAIPLGWSCKKEKDATPTETCKEFKGEIVTTTKNGYFRLGMSLKSPVAISLPNQVDSLETVDVIRLFEGKKFTNVIQVINLPESYQDSLHKVVYLKLRKATQAEIFAFTVPKSSPLLLPGTDCEVCNSAFATAILDAKCNVIQDLVANPN